MGIPNENLPNVSHNRQLPRLADRVQVQPTGMKSQSEAGGEISRTALPESGWERSSRGLRSAPPSGPREPSGVYDREPPPGVSDRTPAS
jgi:hypothetical protein